MSSSNQNNATDSSSQPGNETSFDVNTIVVLAALLCALVAALALNSIIQYALRHRRESLEATAASAMAMKKLPVEVFRSGDIPATECSICLGEFVDGEKVRVLPECKHEFHVKCVDKWLTDHMSCPNCRHLVRLPPEGDRVDVDDHDHGEYDRVVLDFMV